MQMGRNPCSLPDTWDSEVNVFHRYGKPGSRFITCHHHAQITDVSVVLFVGYSADMVKLASPCHAGPRRVAHQGLDDKLKEAKNGEINTRSLNVPYV